MNIQIHPDNNISANEQLTAQLSELVTHGLNRFSHQITSIQVHLTDENGDKGGKDDKRCVMEARLEGMNPIAVTAHGDNIQQAVRGAIEKMKSSLDTKRDKLRTF